MDQGTEWYTRKYTCRNGIEERTKFPVSSAQGITKRKQESDINRAARAADSAERAVARLLNNNFDEHEDLHLVLEYSDEEYELLKKRVRERREMQGEPSADDIIREADRDFVNWVRRVQRRMGDSGRYIYLGVTSDMDGDTKQPARVHHHVVVNKECGAACIEKWTAGYVWHDELYTVRGDFSALAAYMINQVRYIRNRKRYVPSRFLAPAKTSKPIRVTRYGESEMRLPRGAMLLYRSPYIRGQSQYVRYQMPKKE